MVAPLVAAAIAAPVVSGLAQWYNSNEAMKASKAERERIAGLIDKMQDPTFDVSDIRPEEFQVMGKYVPEAARTITESNPELVKGNSAAAQQAKQARMQVLGNMMAQAQSGEDPLFKIQQMQAQRQALDAGNQQRMNLQAQAQRRGTSGSGLDYAAQLASGAQQQDLLARMGMEGAAQAQGRRGQLQSQAAGLAGQVYGDEMNQEQVNARAINDFNQRIANRGQQQENLNVGNRNAANQYNLGAQQDIANRNVGGRNTAMVANQQNRNNIAQQQYGNQLSKIGLQTGQADRNISGINQGAMQQNQAIQSFGDMATKGASYMDQRDQNADWLKAYKDANPAKPKVGV